MDLKNKIKKKNYNYYHNYYKYGKTMNKYIRVVKTYKKFLITFD
jgi:hypothetical protein